jgi:hypothetical protein
MLITLRFIVLIFALAPIIIAAQITPSATLSPAQKRAFVAAVLQTQLQQMEEQLPRKLASLHRFKPYFSMHELATTAYALVIESPHDMSRWRALAKIAAYADGEYFLPYESARREALARNPRLFDSCPEFQRWIDKASHGQGI